MTREATSEMRPDGTQVFERILDREAELKVKVEDAEQRAQMLVEEAHDSIPQFTRDAQQEARVRARAEVQAIETRTQEKIESLRKQHAEECALLREEQRRNVPAAVDFVLDLVTGAQAPYSSEAQEPADTETGEGGEE